MKMYRKTLIFCNYIILHTKLKQLMNLVQNLDQKYQYLHHRQHLKGQTSYSCNIRINIKALTKKKGWKGKWTGRQQQKYVKFLRQNQQIMREKESRKSQKIFLQMSRLIRSRNPDQCRSHHQKLMNYHQSVPQIIKHYNFHVFPSMNQKLGKCDEKEDLSNSSPKNTQHLRPFYSIQISASHLRVFIDSLAISSYFQ